MTELKDIVPYETQRLKIKAFVLGEVIAAAEQSDDLPTFLTKFREKAEEW